MQQSHGDVIVLPRSNGCPIFEPMRRAQRKDHIKDYKRRSMFISLLGWTVQRGVKHEFRAGLVEQRREKVSMFEIPIEHCACIGW